MNEDSLRQQMGMLERAMGAVFVQHDLPVHLCGGIQGPHTLTFAVRLYEPTVGHLSKALRLAPAIEAALGDGPVRVYADRGLIHVEIPSPSPICVPGRALRGQGLDVPLGLTARQAVAGVDFATTPHLLVVGPSGRGKTTALRAVAFHLARQNPFRHVHLIAVTFKPDDWQAVEGLIHTAAVVSVPEEAGPLLAWLVRAMHERTADGVWLPHLFVFLDDLLNLLAAVDVSDPLSQLASLGRAAGIHLVIGTQRLGRRGAGDAAVTGNMPARLVFGTADAQDASFFTGRADSGAERLGRYPGDALLVSDGGAVRLAVSPVSDRDLAALPQASRRGSARGGQGLVARLWGEGLPPAGTDTGTPAQKGDGTVAGAENTAVDGELPVSGPLAYREPTPEERALLRRLYSELGSKNKTLAAAWGGVINESGKTPKTLAWLNQALAELERDAG